MLKVLNQQKQMFTTTQVACWKHHIQISKHDGALYLSEYFRGVLCIYLQSSEQLVRKQHPFFSFENAKKEPLLLLGPL